MILTLQLTIFGRVKKIINQRNAGHGGAYLLLQEAKANRSLSSGDKL